jgi:hypothetical protein
MRLITAGTLAVLLAAGSAGAAQDHRALVAMPAPMQEHMLANMRDHLAALDEILAHLGAGEFDRAAEVAEWRIGMSSLDSHGASHMASVMPAPMREIGTTMHRAASRFARVAEEGDELSAYRALREVTASCVACHAAYRIR